MKERLHRRPLFLVSLQRRRRGRSVLFHSPFDHGQQKKKRILFTNNFDSFYAHYEHCPDRAPFLSSLLHPPMPLPLPPVCTVALLTGWGWWLGAFPFLFVRSSKRRVGRNCQQIFVVRYTHRTHPSLPFSTRSHT